MYKLKEIICSNYFSTQFIKLISHYKKVCYNINVLHLHGTSESTNFELAKQNFGVVMGRLFLPGEVYVVNVKLNNLIVEWWGCEPKSSVFFV